jgi:hypothetical protein
MFSLLTGKSESFVKIWSQLVHQLKFVVLQSPDTLVSFDVVSLFTNVPVDEALQVIRNKLHNDDTLAEMVCLAGRSHHGAAGGLFENHIISGGR